MKTHNEVAAEVDNEVEAIEPQQAGISQVSVMLHFDRYIGLPFWREKTICINVQKEVHPKLGDAKKQAAITASIEKMGIDRETYDRALVMAERPFYTIHDHDPLQGDGEIIIPARVFQSFLNNASQIAPKAIPRISAKGLTFVGIRFRGEVEGLRTGKTRADAEVFSRFVKNEESNQRMLSESLYITTSMHAEKSAWIQKSSRRATYKNLLRGAGSGAGSVGRGRKDSGASLSPVGTFTKMFSLSHGRRRSLSPSPTRARSRSRGQCRSSQSQSRSQSRSWKSWSKSKRPQSESWSESKPASWS